MLRRGPLLIPAIALLALQLGGCRQSVGSSPQPYPVQAEFAAPGPFTTTTGTVMSGKTAVYDTFHPRDYHALGFKSPIVTWGDGTNAVPAMYSTLLDHLASYGFTVIATTLTNTGSGREIDAAAHYLVNQNNTAGSVFHGHLDTHEIAAVGHSQGATGAVRVATMDPSLITSLLTFSLPNSIWAGTNPDCPTKSDCEKNTALVAQPTFFISTYGALDSFVASPATEHAYFNSVKGPAVSGIIATSGGRVADHNSIQDTANGGNPGGELGYATAWLEYTLRASTTAAPAFSGSHAEIASNHNWPGSMVKQCRSTTKKTGRGSPAAKCLSAPAS